ncbi:hypothetical protein KR044_002560 [Drosophila immigrans]|nr:hypothetical protein KR044_002560 [Drosophila immigrans]
MEWGEDQEQVSDLESEHALDIAQEQDFSEVEYESEQEVIFEPELELMQEQDFEVKLVPLTAESRKRRNSETLTHNKRQKLWQQDNDDEQEPQTSLEAVGATTEMECDLDSDSESELKLFDCETLMEAAKEWDNWHDFLIEKMHCQQLLKSLTSQKRCRINWPFNNADVWSEDIYKIDWKILGSQLDSNQYESFDAFVCAISLMFQRAQVHFRNNESLIDAVRNLNHVLQKSLNKYRQSIMKMKIQLKCMSIIRANVFKSALLQEE